MMFYKLLALQGFSRGHRAGNLKRVLFFCGAVAALVSFSGCAGTAVQIQRAAANGPAVLGSGQLVTREVAISDFAEVEVDNTLKVDLTRGDKHRVSITADDNAIDYIVAERTGSILKVGVQPGSYSNVTLRVSATMPELSRLQLAGASSATLAGFKPRAIDLRLTGASQLTGRLEAGQVSLSVSEASKANLGGTSDTVILRASGAGEASLGDLVAGTANVTMKESSSGTVNVTGRLDADMRSASTLYYVGNPSLGTVTSVESSSVKRR